MDSRRRPLPKNRKTSATASSHDQIPTTGRTPSHTRATPTERTPSPARTTPAERTSSPVGSKPAMRTSSPATAPQQPRQNKTTVTGHKKKSSLGARIGSTVLKVLAFVLATLLFILVVIGGSLKMMCSDSNKTAQTLMVNTFLETGKLKFVAKLFAGKDKVNEIVDANKMEEFNDEVDSTLISIPGTGLNAGEKDIEVIEIPGPTYKGTLLIVKDPSRVFVATMYPWQEEGKTLDYIAESVDAVAAINGGLYNSYVNKGGMPYGVVVSNGEIQFNEPQNFAGLVLIGFTEKNILEIIDIDGMGPAEVENLIAERHIRDAVTFQEEATDANNHFVQLVINGEPRDLNGGAGSGLNPRTVIGQRADGAILMLVTDGRGKNNHLGASAADLIEIMMKYGAVNAANLDGGSSSCMYYNGEYLMTSVTFYYTNSSWNLPLAFAVSK